MVCSNFVKSKHHRCVARAILSRESAMRRGGFWDTTVARTSSSTEESASPVECTEVESTELLVASHLAFSGSSSVREFLLSFATTRGARVRNPSKLPWPGTGRGSPRRAGRPMTRVAHVAERARRCDEGMATNGSDFSVPTFKFFILTPFPRTRKWPRALCGGASPRVACTPTWGTHGRSVLLGAADAGGWR